MVWNTWSLYSLYVINGSRYTTFMSSFVVLSVFKEESTWNTSLPSIYYLYINFICGTFCYYSWHFFSFCPFPCILLRHSQYTTSSTSEWVFSFKFLEFIDLKLSFYRPPCHSSLRDSDLLWTVQISCIPSSPTDLPILLTFFCSVSVTLLVESTPKSPVTLHKPKITLSAP